MPKPTPQPASDPLREDWAEYALFLYEEVTASVKAGVRFPAERSNTGEFTATITRFVPLAHGIALQAKRRADGQYVSLWYTHKITSVAVGDTIRFHLATSEGARRADT